MFRLAFKAADFERALASFLRYIIAGDDLIKVYFFTLEGLSIPIFFLIFILPAADFNKELFATLFVEDDGNVGLLLEVIQAFIDSITIPSLLLTPLTVTKKGLSFKGYSKVILKRLIPAAGGLYILIISAGGSIVRLLPIPVYFLSFPVPLLY